MKEQWSNDTIQSLNFVASNLESGKDILLQGPAYEIEGRNGEIIQVKSMWEPLSNPYISKYYLIAADSRGNIIGYRYGSLNYTAISDGILASGRIDILQKGAGLATSLELVHLDFLSRIAAEKRRDVLYQILDFNSTNSEKNEHERWSSLYGPNGKLGVRDDYSIFLPVTDMPSLHNIDRIKLSRKDITSEGRNLIKPDVIEVVNTLEDDSIKAGVNQEIIDNIKSLISEK
jgi:hypothetical protein